LGKFTGSEDASVGPILALGRQHGKPPLAHPQRRRQGHHDTPDKYGASIAEGARARRAILDAGSFNIRTREKFGHRANWFMEDTLRRLLVLVQ